MRGMKCRGNPLHEDFINPVIASVAKQSPTWNKYSNYYFLSAEIAAGINALAMTFVLSPEIGLLGSLARNDSI